MADKYYMIMKGGREVKKDDNNIALMMIFTSELSLIRQDVVCLTISYTHTRVKPCNS